MSLEDEKLTERKLKILIATETFLPVLGGAQTVVDKSAINLSKFCDVTVATTKYNNYNYPERPYKLLLCKGFYNKITKDGIPFVFLDKKFRKEIMEGKFDVIHCHNAGFLYNYMLKIGKKLHIPVISTVHNVMYHDIKKILKLDFLAKMLTRSFKSDFVWKISESSFNFLKQFGIREDCEEMRNCVDLKPEKDIIENGKNEILDKYNLHGKVILLNVGRVIETKNVDWLITVAKKLKKESKNFKIIVVGNGDYFKTFNNLIAKNKLEDEFLLVGSISDRKLLSKFYSSCDLLLFPSVKEVSPLIPVEAAAFKKATLTPCDSPAAERIIDCKNGYVSQSSSEGFAEKVSYILDNLDQTKEIGENAFKSIYRCYSDEKMIKELIDHYLEDIKKYKEKLNKN